MRTCTKCGQPKDMDDFAWKLKSKGIRHSSCKECQRVAVKNHYNANKEQYLLRRDESTERKKDYVRSLKENATCKDCGNKYPHYILQFDHVETKTENVSVLVSNSWNKLLAEIAKCDIVCANCHAARTYHRRIGHVCQPSAEQHDRESCG